MKSILLFSVLALASSAFANLSGDWKGTGKITENGVVSFCEQVAFNVEHTAKALLIKSGGYSCGNSLTIWPAKNLEINGYDLLMNGKKIGAISPTATTATVMSADKKYKTIYHAYLVGDGLAFRENVYDLSTSSLVLSLEANLKK